MLNDDTHAQHICNSKRVALIMVGIISAECLTVPKRVYKFSIFFSRCNDTCTSFSKCYIIKQLLTNEALDMM